MIKSQGHRIELGDIETTLYNHPKIASVALLAVPDEQISHRLVPHSDIGAPDASLASTFAMKKH